MIKLAKPRRKRMICNGKKDARHMRFLLNSAERVDGDDAAQV